MNFRVRNAHWNRQIRFWWPDHCMCITEGDEYFAHHENRMMTPMRVHSIEYRKASSYDAASGAGIDGGTPYGVDRGQPDGSFKLYTFSSRRVQAQ